MKLKSYLKSGENIKRNIAAAPFGTIVQQHFVSVLYIYVFNVIFVHTVAVSVPTL